MTAVTDSGVLRRKRAALYSVSKPRARKEAADNEADCTPNGGGGSDVFRPWLPVGFTRLLRDDLALKMPTEPGHHPKVMSQVPACRW